MRKFPTDNTTISDGAALFGGKSYGEIKTLWNMYELAEKYGTTMSRITFAWHFYKGVTSPVVGATKAKYLDDAAGALEIRLTKEDADYIDELYVPHKIVGAI